MDENGIAHPESNFKKDDDKKEEKDVFSSKYGYSSLGENPYYTLMNHPLLGASVSIPTLDPILCSIKFGVD